VVLALVCAAVSPAAGAEGTTTLTSGPDGMNVRLRVPAGVVSVEVTAVGGAGGSGCARGGRGAVVQAVLPVAVGEELAGEVGSGGEANEAVFGQPACAGGTGNGWYDHGWGRMGSGGLAGGGSAGGGASWLAGYPASFGCCVIEEPWGIGRPLVVAGGGGGGGYGEGATGGDAGAVGQPGSAAAGLGGRGGSGAGTSAGGTGGEGASGAECSGSGSSGRVGSAGRGGEGGNAESGEVQAHGDAGGGGGGAGWYGGGGGGGGAHYASLAALAQTCVGAGGGGGGSSFSAVAPLQMAPSDEAPHLTISYTPLPAPSIAIATPADGARYELGQRVAVAYACADAAASPGIAACEASQPAGPFPTVQPVAPGGLLFTSREGSHTIVVNARSRDGLTAFARSEYTVVPRGTLSGAVSAPSLHALAQRHVRWREPGAAARRRARLPVGTRFSFTLSAPARVGLAFTRHAGGRARAAGTISIAARAGHDSVGFDGLLAHGRRLRRGRYTVTATAIGPDGARSAPLRLAFTIA
jgi:hypothetical protein